MARQPFNLLRAVFWLLAIVMVIELLFSIVGGLLCWWINFTGVRQPLACLEAAQMIREFFQELLTAILALLLATRPPAPPPPDAPDE